MRKFMGVKKASMKIALVSPLDRRTGVAKYSYTLAKALLHKGVNVTFFCRDPNDPNNYSENDNTVTIEALTSKKLSDCDIIHFQLGDSPYHHFQSHILSRMKQTKTRKIATIHDPQINACFEPLCKSCCIQVLLKTHGLLQRMPFTLRCAIYDHHFRSQFPHEFMNILWSRLLDGMIFHSQCCRQSFRSRTDFQVSSTLIRHIGYLDHFNGITEKRQREPVLLIPNAVVGRSRGIRFIIGVLAELPFEFGAVFTGRFTGYEEKMLAIAHRRELGGKVKFVGLLSEEDYIRQLKSCSMVLILRSISRGEVSGNMIHAMCAGKPVIASKLGAFPEYLSGRGLLCDAHSLNAWKSAITALAEDEKLRVELGSRAREFAETELSGARIAEEHMRFYAEILEEQN
jgi:glycosyltransferase involved in cell wall biosynthesis